MGPVIIWTPSKEYNERILRYDIRVTSKVGATVILEKKPQEFYHLLSRGDIPADLGGASTVTVQV